MAHVTVERTIAAPVADVWSSWDDFGAIYHFNPNLKGSRLINNSPKSGIGARRQCDLADGKNYIRERIIGYTPEEEMTIDIYEGTMPLKKAVATLRLTALNDSSTRVSMTMEFEPKLGLIGKMMVPMMKPQFAKMLGALLEGNDHFVTKGKQAVAA